MTKREETGTGFEYNKVVIPYGTIVLGKETRCDGIVDCHSQQDEQGCGLGSFQTSLLGDYIFLYTKDFVPFKIMSLNFHSRF